MGGSTYRDMCFRGFKCEFIGSSAVISIVITRCFVSIKAQQGLVAFAVLLPRSL